MSWAAPIIVDFGRSIGIDALAVDDSGAVNLRLGDDGLLCLQPMEEEFLVYMAREIPAHEEVYKLRALALCGPERQWPWPVQAGTRGADRLLFLMRLPQHDVSLAAIEQAMDVLTRLHGMVRQG